MQNLLQAGLFLQITPGRLATIVYALVGLASVIIGGMALARSAGRVGWRRPGAVVALVAGLTGVILSGVHLAGAGDFGTGSGRAGAVVALVLGLTGMGLGGWAWRGRS